IVGGEVGGYVLVGSLPHQLLGVGRCRQHHDPDTTGGYGFSSGQQDHLANLVWRVARFPTWHPSLALASGRTRAGRLTLATPTRRCHAARATAWLDYSKSRRVCQLRGWWWWLGRVS